MTYRIITRNQLGEWTSSPEETAQYIGGAATDNRFGTEDEAHDAIDQLVATFRRSDPDAGISADDYRILAQQ